MSFWYVNEERINPLHDGNEDGEVLGYQLCSVGRVTHREDSAPAKGGGQGARERIVRNVHCAESREEVCPVTGGISRQRTTAPQSKQTPSVPMYIR